jgi:uncharacterized protein
MSDPRSVNKLPRYVDPRKLAARSEHLQGPVPGDELLRLSEAVLTIADCSADMVFSRDAQHRNVIDGSFALNVTMSCQRCMQPVTKSISGEFQVGVVWDEERAAELPKRLDPWLVSEETGDLYELLEDELLLSLPIVAYHNEADCAAKGSFSTGDHEVVRENAFSILSKLKE